MKVIKVEEMFECPFQYEEAYSYSEYTHGVDTKCKITKDDCYLSQCPLREEKKIKVVWAKKGGKE